MMIGFNGVCRNCGREVKEEFFEKGRLVCEYCCDNIDLIKITEDGLPLIADMEQDKSFYQQWLENNNLKDTEENNNYWFNTHCQFCGNNNEYDNCECDRMIRY